MQCESHFEELVRNGQQPTAPTAARRTSASSSRSSRRTARAHRRRSTPDRRPAVAVAAAVAAAAAELSAAAPRLARVDTLHALGEQVSACTRCRLAQGRTQVVFGVGNPHADLMFVGEAPGFHEDKQGLPFVGQAGKLLDKLLAGIGLDRSTGLHRQRPQVPPARQPRPAARRDRVLRAAPLPPDRADRAEGGRDARQLRDEAPVRQADRDHPCARRRAGDHGRRQPTSSSTRSTTRPPRSTRRRCSRCWRRTSRGSRS